MFSNLTGWHALLILAVVLLMFGAPKIPALARSLGQSMRIFKSEIREKDAESADGVAEAPVATTTVTPAIVAPAASIPDSRP
jgi:sec-independent protein translocase protein TatA